MPKSMTKEQFLGWMRLLTVTTLVLLISGFVCHLVQFSKEQLQTMILPVLGAVGMVIVHGIKREAGLVEESTDGRSTTTEK